MKVKSHKQQSLWWFVAGCLKINILSIKSGHKKHNRPYYPVENLYNHLINPTTKKSSYCETKVLPSSPDNRLTAAPRKMPNITGGEGNFIFKVQDTPPVGMIAFFVALNILFSITATLGNVLILIALHKVTSIYPPTKLLFRCLAVTDLCVGLISQPLYVVVLVNVGITNSDENIFYYAALLYTFSTTTLCGVSLMTSTAISVDRLLALLLGLRYRHVVTLRRVRAVIICFWLLYAAVGGFFFTSPISHYVYIVLMISCLLISAFSYIKIYVRLRHQLLHVQGHVHQQQPAPSGVVATALNVARYKKTVSTIAWVQLGLFACYFPVSVFLVMAMFGFNFSMIFNTISNLSLSLLYLNSSLNPILYCWKIREVKQEVKDTITQLNCCCQPN